MTKSEPITVDVKKLKKQKAVIRKLLAGKRLTIAEITILGSIVTLLTEIEEYVSGEGGRP